MNKMKKKKLTMIFLAMLLSLGVSLQAQKREVRGAWLNTIYRSEYARLTPTQCKEYLAGQLDKLQAAGVNAVFFQVRPQADAFYPSELEPWSRYLTTGGKAPKPFWDPLQFMIDEAHVRGMELHAWLNPYRVTSNAKQTLPAGHIYHKHPERFIRYEGKLYFDPALQANRDFICSVVRDILSRYDVDGIHFDDYFYPYPGKTAFPDDKSYQRLGKGMKRDDWRRKNVDMLIEQLSSEIHSKKSWVRFGVSPFGIWRNHKSDERGSDTAGLENYDALYADVLLWAEKGWVDYLIPQLYWERGHKAADYDVLVKWWAENVATGCQLYIGQDVNRTMDKADTDSSAADQLESKLKACSESEAIKGICWWPAYSVTDNYKGVSDRLRGSLHRHRALVPEYSHEKAAEPEAPGNVRIEGGRLQWTAPAVKGEAGDAVRFVVYYSKDKKMDIEKAENIFAVTGEKSVATGGKGYYLVTALNRLNAESRPSAAVKVQ